MDFTGRHIVITGASSGIGRATAESIARAGGRVTLIARRGELLRQIAAELGNGARGIAADISVRAELEGALDEAEAANGPMDGLFLNAAAGGTFTTIPDYPEDVFEELITTNLRSPFWAVRKVMPAMAARGGGAILITGSLASERGMVGNPGYLITKHALHGIAMAVAAEAAPARVRCNLLVPGFIDTDMLNAAPPEALAVMAARTPQGRIGRPEEAANVAAFLLSDLASHVTAQTWAVDGGLLGTLML